MKSCVYKLIGLAGTSTTFIEDAVGRAVQRAHKTIKNLCWFQVVETHGDINKQKLHHWQVSAFAECTMQRHRSCKVQ